MNLPSMQNKFAERTGNLSSDLTETEINEMLNGAYQYGIASEVPGGLTQGEWSLSTSDGEDTYDYPDSVYEARRGVRIGTSWLDVYFRKDQFDYDHSSTSSEQKPYAVLFYGRQAQFYPTPDASYTVLIPARLYPSSSLTTNGLANYNHAMAVVCEAAREYLLDNEEAEKAALRESDRDMYIRRLKGASLSRVRERRARLSF